MLLQKRGWLDNQILKVVLLFLSCFILFLNTLKGQSDSIEIVNNKLFSASLASPIYFRSYGGYWDRFIVAFRGEYVFYKNQNVKKAVSVCIGRTFSKSNFSPSNPVFLAEVNWVRGKKVHFFEYGIGMGVVSVAACIQCSLGYRLEFSQHGLFRIGYNPYLWLEPHSESEVLPYYTGSHNLSVSLGYRFGLGRKKQSDR